MGRNGGLGNWRLGNRGLGDWGLGTRGLGTRGLGSGAESARVRERAFEEIFLI